MALVSTLPKVQSRTDPDYDSGSVLQFIAVNRPSDVQYAEDVVPPTINMKDWPQEVIPGVENPLIKSEQINAPDFDVFYMHINPGQFQWRAKSDGTNGTVVANVTNTMYDPISNDIDLMYSKVLTVVLEGSWTLNYSELSDPTRTTVHSITVADTDPIEKRANLFKNVPFAPYNKVATMVANQPTVLLNLSPLKHNIRYDHTADDLYKFELYDMKAGDVINTKTFAGATYGHIHTCKGSVSIGSKQIPFQRFYEIDPTIPVEVTAQEDSIVLLSAKVPTIDLTNLQ